MAQACGLKRSCVTNIRHALPPLVFYQHGKISRKSVKPTNGSVQQSKVAATDSRRKKIMLPVSPCRRTIRGRIFVPNRPQSKPDFRRQRDDFAAIGFVHKIAIFRIASRFPGRRFPRAARFAGIALSCPISAFCKARNQTQNRRLATAARPFQLSYAMLRVQIEIAHDGVAEISKRVFKTTSPSTA